jgi:hypothetical protein
MLDQLKQYLGLVEPIRKMNALREYLQWLILKIIDARNYRKSMVFVGGTALRVIYQASRFSEDLDFSCVPGSKIDFRAMGGTVQRELAQYGLSVAISSPKTKGAVSSCFFKFSGLLAPLSVTTDPHQKISIKLEVDQNPPSGGTIQEYFFNGPLLFSVNHHDLPSLFAGKLHALLFRKYAKGRDYYDLLFYLRQKCVFNLNLFRNATQQTHPRAKFPDVAAVLKGLKEIILKMDNAGIQKDLAPFLLEPDEIQYVNSKYLLMALEQNMEAGIYTIVK